MNSLSGSAVVALRFRNILRPPPAAYITDMQPLKAPFKFFLCISNVLYYSDRGRVHRQDLCAVVVH